MLYNIILIAEIQKTFIIETQCIPPFKYIVVTRKIHRTRIKKNCQS
jgi:hypothetical protein